VQGEEDDGMTSPTIKRKEEEAAARRLL